MPYSKVEITEYSHRIGKSVPTLWRWIREGCDLRDPRHELFSAEIIAEKWYIRGNADCWRQFRSRNQG
jgi:hypothetical protein